MSGIIYIQGLPFRRNQEELTSSGIGISAWAGGEYQYPLEERWRLRAGADVSRREYRESEFDRMTVSAYLGPRWLIGRGSEASLLASARQSWLSDEKESRDLGIRIEARHRLSLRTTARLNASWYQRRYERRTHLDGPITDLSAGVGWVASPTTRIEATLGWGRDRTELERERNSRRWMRLGATFALPLGFTVGASGTLRWTDYQGDWLFYTPGGSSRRDLTRNFRLDVVQPRRHRGRVQSAGLRGARGPGQHRPALRLRAHLRRAALRAPVLRLCGARPMSTDGPWTGSRGWPRSTV